MEHLARSLQTKWCHHQTQCHNFFSNYGLVVALCEYELVLRTQYKKPLNYTKSKHSKSYGCSFVHCCCCFTISMLGRYLSKSLKNPLNETWGKNKANNIDVVEFDLGEVQTINFRCQDISMNSRFAKKHSHGNKIT